MGFCAISQASQMNPFIVEALAFVANYAFEITSTSALSGYLLYNSSAISESDRDFNQRFEAFMEFENNKKRLHSQLKHSLSTPQPVSKRRFKLSYAIPRISSANIVNAYRLPARRTYRRWHKKGRRIARRRRRVTPA